MDLKHQDVMFLILVLKNFFLYTYMLIIILFYNYLNECILGVLKDIQETPFALLQHREHDIARLSLFPSLDYKSLHQALTQLVDVIPLVQFGSHGNIHHININMISMLYILLCF